MRRYAAIAQIALSRLSGPGLLLLRLALLQRGDVALDGLALLLKLFDGTLESATAHARTMRGVAREWCGTGRRRAGLQAERRAEAQRQRASSHGIAHLQMRCNSGMGRCSSRFVRSAGLSSCTHRKSSHVMCVLGRATS